MTNKRRPVIATLLFVVLTLTMILAVACGGSTSPASSPAASPKASAPASTPASPSPSASAADAAWQQVIAAAEKEQGPAVIYSVFADDFNNMFMQTFNKIDPKIQVKIIRMLSVAATERVRAEQSTKQYVGNAYLGGIVRPMAQEGFGQAVDLPAVHEPGVKWIIDPYMDKAAGLDTIVNSFNKFVLVVNNNLVPAGQEPKTWTDLTDPKWKDQLTMWDPHIHGIGQALLDFLYLDSNHGPDVAHKILENVKIAADSGEAARMVAQGEAKVGVTTWGDYLAIKEGPVRLASPSDGAAGNQTYTLMFKNAPQPATTRVFLNWLMTKDGQQIIGKGYTAIRGDIQAEAKDAQFLPGEKLLDNIPQSVDFETNKYHTPDPTILQWLKEMGK